MEEPKGAANLSSRCGIHTVPTKHAVKNKCSLNTLKSHVIEHGMVSDRQFGFRTGSSTQEAVKE